MLPILTFASGIIVGAAGVKLMRDKKTQEAVKKAVTSSVEAVQKTSADLKAKVYDKEETPEETVDDKPEKPAPKKTAAKPRRKPAAKKTTATTPKPEEGTDA